MSSEEVTPRARFGSGTFRSRQMWASNVDEVRGVASTPRSPTRAQDADFQAAYREHRPMVEHSIARLVAGPNRLLRFRGTQLNDLLLAPQLWHGLVPVQKRAAGVDLVDVLGAREHQPEFRPAPGHRAMHGRRGSHVRTSALDGAPYPI